VIVPLHSIQIETGFLYQKEELSESGRQFELENLTLAATLIRYGLHKCLELRLGGDYLHINKKLNGMHSITVGLENIFIGWKLILRHHKKIINNSALIFELTLPYGSKYFRPDEPVPTVCFAAEQAINGKSSMALNSGLEIHNRENRAFYSISLGIDMTPNTGLFIEYFGDVAGSTPARSNFDLGFTYLPFKTNLQLDFSAGSRLLYDKIDWFAGMGVSLRLPE
jgi:hypothetical protein